MNTLAIDPSINHIGWALDANGSWRTGKFSPYGVGMAQKLDSIGSWIQSTFYGKGIEIDFLVLEYPQFFNSERGRIAARAGFTLGLSCICGYLMAFCQLSSRQVAFYTPSQWKGSVSKEVTYKKMLRHFNVKVRPSEDEIDALMLLFFHFEKSGGNVGV